MKKLSLTLLMFVSAIASFAQAGKTKVATPTQQPVCKNLYDSASYAVGVSVANFYKRQGLTNLNAAMVSRAINDVLNGKSTVLDDNTASSVLGNYISVQNADKAKVNIKAGEQFLAQNKTKPNVKTTTTGLQYEVITEGTGPKPASASDNVTCNYQGTLLDGTEFDNSYKRGQPATFALNQVIPGWTEGLQLMNTGSKYRFWIPYNLGYGINGRPGIPGGALLVFEVELLEVKK